MIVEGQVHGGLAQGIAQALYEEAVYDDDGNLVTGTLADYLVPSAADLPSYVTDRTESPALEPARRQGRRRGRHDRLDPGGGERDRGRGPAAGGQDIPMPCTPERVWRAIHTARSNGGQQSGGAA